MKAAELEKMRVDELWILHERIGLILERKIESERSRLQDQLDQLGRKFGGSPSDIPQRRPYPKVEPKYQNPERPSETWSGRGKRPHWVNEWLAAGRDIGALRILKDAS